MGETSRNPAAMNAGAPGARRQSRMASRKVTSSPREAKTSMAMRVVRGEKPASVHRAARYAITAGGCTLGTAVRGIHEPL